MAESEQSLQVQISYVKPDLQILHDLIVPVGTTIHRAIIESGILQQAPEIDLSVCRVGIYGKLKALDTVVRNQDRIEIYRALIADPMDARRRRAVKKGEKKPIG